MFTAAISLHDELCSCSIVQFEAGQQPVVADRFICESLKVLIKDAAFWRCGGEAVRCLVVDAVLDGTLVTREVRRRGVPWIMAGYGQASSFFSRNRSRHGEIFGHQWRLTGLSSSQIQKIIFNGDYWRELAVEIFKGFKPLPRERRLVASVASRGWINSAFDELAICCVAGSTQGWVPSQAANPFYEQCRLDVDDPTATYTAMTHEVNHVG